MTEVKRVAGKAGYGTWPWLIAAAFVAPGLIVFLPFAATWQQKFEIVLLAWISMLFFLVACSSIGQVFTSLRRHNRALQWAYAGTALTLLLVSWSAGAIGERVAYFSAEHYPKLLLSPSPPQIDNMVQFTALRQRCQAPIDLRQDGHGLLLRCGDWWPKVKVWLYDTPPAFVQNELGFKVEE